MNKQSTKNVKIFVKSKSLYTLQTKKPGRGESKESHHASQTAGWMDKGREVKRNGWRAKKAKKSKKCLDRQRETLS